MYPKELGLVLDKDELEDLSDQLYLQKKLEVDEYLYYDKELNIRIGKDKEFTLVETEPAEVGSTSSLRSPFEPTREAHNFTYNSMPPRLAFTIDDSRPSTSLTRPSNRFMIQQLFTKQEQIQLQDHIAKKALDFPDKIEDLKLLQSFLRSLTAKN